MTYNEKKREYNVGYTKEHYKRVPLELTHDKYNEVKHAATNAGESVNGYIKAAIDKRLESGE